MADFRMEGSTVSEPTVAYLNSNSFGFLRTEVSCLQRMIHKELDNYGMEMSPDLKNELLALERACKEANKKMQAEYGAFKSH